MAIINLLAAGSKLSPDQIGLIVLLCFLAALLIAANIVLWYIFHKRAEARAIDKRSKADGWTGKEPEQETASAETAQDKTETETK